MAHCHGCRRKIPMSVRLLFIMHVLHKSCPGRHLVTFYGTGVGAFFLRHNLTKRKDGNARDSQLFP